MQKHIECGELAIRFKYAFWSYFKSRNPEVHGNRLVALHSPNACGIERKIIPIFIG